MICLMTTIRTDGDSARPKTESGHMAWNNPTEAYIYAQAVYGVRLDAQHRLRNQFSIELSVCDYPDTCPVQDGIRKGRYVHAALNPITEKPRLVEG